MMQVYQNNITEKKKINNKTNFDYKRIQTLYSSLSSLIYSNFEL